MTGFLVGLVRLFVCLFLWLSFVVIIVCVQFLSYASISMWRFSFQVQLNSQNPDGFTSILKYNLFTIESFRSSFRILFFSSISNRSTHKVYNYSHTHTHRLTENKKEEVNKERKRKNEEEKNFKLRLCVRWNDEKGVKREWIFIPFVFGAGKCKIFIIYWICVLNVEYTHQQEGIPFSPKKKNLSEVLSASRNSHVFGFYMCKVS